MSENEKPADPEEVAAEPTKPPTVSVILQVDEATGAISVADVRLEGGLTVDRSIWWLEEGIKYVRQAFNKP